MLESINSINDGPNHCAMVASFTLVKSTDFAEKRIDQF